LKGEQARRIKAEREERDRGSGSKDKYTRNCWRGTRAMIVSVSGLA